MSTMSGKEMQEQFSNHCNTFTPDVETFIEGLKQDHRTLQQSQVRFMLKVIEAMAEQQYTDARNQQAVLTCKRIVDAFKNENGYKPSEGLGSI